MPQWAKRDESATRAARKSKRFLSMKSWIGTRKNGDLYLRLHGKDKEAQRERLLLEWDGYCQNCFQPKRNGEVELDHTIPLSRGGDCQDRNLRFLCRPCHRAKHNREIRLRWIPKLTQEGA